MEQLELASENSDLQSWRPSREPEDTNSVKDDFHSLKISLKEGMKNLQLGIDSMVVYIVDAIKEPSINDSLKEDLKSLKTLAHQISARSSPAPGPPMSEKKIKKDSIYQAKKIKRTGKYLQGCITTLDQSDEEKPSRRTKRFKKNK